MITIVVVGRFVRRRRLLKHLSHDVHPPPPPPRPIRDSIEPAIFSPKGMYVRQYHSDAPHCTRIKRMMSPPAPLGAAIAMVIVPRIDNTTRVAGIHLRRANILFTHTHTHTHKHTFTRKNIIITHTHILLQNVTLHITRFHSPPFQYHTRVRGRTYLFACVRGPVHMYIASRYVYVQRRVCPRTGGGGGGGVI